MTEMENERDDLLPPADTPAERRRIRISKLYRKCPQSSTPSPFSHRQLVGEDYTWNTIRHVTMESTFDMNMLANPLIHVFYAFSPLKSLILEHVCQEENCVKCELHFLFRAFKATDDRKQSGEEMGKIKTKFITTNLAWALARNGIRLTNVFDVVDQILTLLVAEIDDEKLKNRYERRVRCTMCGAGQQKKVELEAMLRIDSSETKSFVRMVETALHLKKGTSEQCEECLQTAEMQCSRKVCQLSPVLLINTINSSEESETCWRRNCARFERKPIGKQDEYLPETGGVEKNKPCRFGKECRNKWVVFFRILVNSRIF